MTSQGTAFPLSSVQNSALGSGYRGIDVRLGPPAVAAWCGALLGLHLGSSETASAWGLIGTATVAATVILGWAVAKIVCGTRHPALTGAAARMTRSTTSTTSVIPVAAMTAIIAVIACGGAAVARQQWETHPLLHTKRGESVSVYGRVIADPVQAASSWDSSAWRITLLTPKKGRLLVTVADSSADSRLTRGTIVAVQGRFDRPEDASPPFLGFIRAQDITVVSPASRWHQEVATVKTTLHSLITAHAGSAGPLISGMAIGDDRGLPPATADAMLTTSLTHLTAVSGSHIAISLSVVGVLLPGMRRARALFTGAFLIAVVAVVGPQPAVLRAVGMGALAAWGMAMGRGGQSLAMLCAVTIAAILIDPWNARSVGFALSTLATLGLITLGRPLATRARSFISEGTRSGPLALALVEASVIATVAQLFTLPILALLNPWLPTWGIVANVLVAPLVTPLTLLGLGAAITCLWWPAAASFLIVLASPLAQTMESVALRIAQWPLAQLPWPGGGWATLAATGITVGAVAALAKWAMVS